MDKRPTRVETGEGRTRQSMRDEVDINKIVGRFMKTGQLSHLERRSAIFADVSEIGDYRECLERVKSVQDAFFKEVPAKVRERFGHDPARFLEFISDPRNADEMVELGLRKKPEVAEAKKPPVDEVAGPGVQHRGVDGRFESPNK